MIRKTLFSGRLTMNDRARFEKLALDGGQPVRQLPFAPWPQFEQDEIEAAVRVLQYGRINYWTGEEGRQFAQEFPAPTASKDGVAVGNSKMALELGPYTHGSDS